ncbi:Gfo/Idh/MocA family oxidoreductase [Microbacterium timonense]|uniref:Gfo/Idh/MocA family oxidoreductase n=1 Tax=Microbacterium timonense TaxID=2086576 RepID=UPI002E0FF7C9
MFGRATGTHATETAHAEIWGTHGSVHWTPFDSHRPVVIRSDEDGQAVEREVAPPPRSEISIMERPLLAFVDAVRGRASAATTGRRAVAEFLVLQAIYQAARTGTPQTVEVGA